MTRVLIFGAGSIGTHLSQAARRMEHDVTVVDTNAEALRRMREEIYPARYGQWDDSITQIESSAAEFTPGEFDIIMVGTPPDSHMQIALEALKFQPKILHVEKPLFRPTDDFEAFVEACEAYPNTIVTVGYDHAIAPSFQALLSCVASGEHGQVISIDGATREHWDGIFKAHPWLAGPQDSYLGYTLRGGGAACEHSHALHLVLSVAEVAGWRGVVGTCVLDMVKGLHGEHYDRVASFQLCSDTGLIARVIQDVVTKPTEKYVRVQCENAVLTWQGEPSVDTLSIFAFGKEAIVQRFEKTRQDDFFFLMQHYANLLNGSASYARSPIRLETGLQVMRIIKSGLS